MSQSPDIRYLIPEEHFHTPEDRTTWTTILRARYWNDRLQGITDAEKMPLEELKKRYPLPTKEIKREHSPIFKFETGNPSADTLFSVKTEIMSPVKQIPFFEILKRQQKPSLFGNSIVSLDTSLKFEALARSSRGTKRSNSDETPEDSPETKRNS